MLRDAPATAIGILAVADGGAPFSKCSGLKLSKAALSEIAETLKDLQRQEKEDRTESLRLLGVLPPGVFRATHMPRLLVVSGKIYADWKSFLI